MFNDKGKINPWENKKIELYLKDTHKIYCFQIIDALPKTRKDNFLKNKENAKDLVIFDHRIVRIAALCFFENPFETPQLNWKKIYFLICSTNLDTKARMFQYKVLHNILFTNRMCFKFGKVISLPFSFSKLHDETVMEFSDMYATECRIFGYGT